MPGKRYNLRESIKQWPEGDRPREKLRAKGPSALSDSELLAIIITSGSGKKNALDLAREMITKFDDLQGIESASIDELCSISGIGASKATMIKAGMELGKRYVSTPRKGKTASIRTAEDAFTICSASMKNLKKEIFLIMLLNPKNKLMKTITISQGALTGTIVHPREVFNPAVRESAHGVILAHNHPSGDPEPSEEDISLTNRLVEAGSLMGINVVDHVIIGDNKYYSFVENGSLGKEH